MVSALGSGLGIVGFSPAEGTTLCCRARHFQSDSCVPLSNIMLGLTL